MNKNQEVLVLLKNSPPIQGKFISLSHQQLVLNQDGNELMILAPMENVVVIKALSKKQEQNQRQEQIHPAQRKKFLQDKFNEVVQEPQSDERLKTLAELKDQLNQCEREILQNSLSSHSIQEIIPQSYQNPFIKNDKFQKNKGAKQYPASQTQA